MVNKISGEEDLDKVDDSELILGAKEIDMILDVGYQHLAYIKYMLQIERCSRKHIEMLDILDKKNTSPVVHEVIETIKNYGASLATYRRDTTVKQKMASLESLL